MRASRTPLRLAIAATLAGSAIVIPASSASAAATGAYGGDAAAHIASATIGIANAPALTAAIGNATAQAASDGTGLPAGKTSVAQANELNVDSIGSLAALAPLVGAVGSISDQVLGLVTQNAAPDNASPATHVAVALPAELQPILSLAAGTQSALAHPAGNDSAACPAAGAPIDRGASEVASFGVLGAQVNLQNGQGGTVFSAGQTELAATSAVSRAVKSTATTQLTQVTVGDPQSPALQIAVSSPPTLTATAPGTVGGAAVVYNAPIVTVTTQGNQQTVLSGANQSVSVPLGVLNVTVTLGELTNVHTAGDGTSASGDAALIHLTITALAGLVSVDVPIAPLHVSAFAPVGGVLCGNPLDASHKDADATDIAPGATFHYLVTAKNSATTPVSDVKVVDTLTAPAGTKIVAASNGGVISGLTVTWENLGSLGAAGSTNPSDTIVLTVTVKAPARNVASVYHNHAVISGTVRGERFDKGVDKDGPTVTPTPVVTPTNAPRGTLAATGGNPTLPLFGTVLLGGAVALLARRRRSLAD